MKANYGVFIRDKDGTLRDRINDFSSLSILDTLNAVGSWNMSSMTAEPCPLKPGMGIIVSRNNVFCYSGIVEQIQDVYDTSKGLYQWQVQGVGDLGYLNRRICYVDPATGRTDQIDHYTDTGKLSEVVERLIAKNIGPDALPDRKETIIESNVNAINEHAYGPDVSAYLRFQNLLDAVKALCVSNLYNFRPVWDEARSKLYYEVFLGRDLTNAIVFTEQLNNITESERLAVVPEGNFILAGGVGELTERTFATAQNDDSIGNWGRIEVFQDVRNQYDVDSYVEEVLVKKSEGTSGYSVTASDADNAPQYGIDYRIGDYVSMKIEDQYISAQVQQCQIDVSDGVETLSPKFGTVALGRFKSIYSQLDNLRADVNELLGTEIE